jgi:ABC-2 type transport system permease protein
MNMVIAFFFKDLAMERSYRFHLSVKVLAVFFQLAIFYFLSRFMANSNYFPYVFCGLVFSRFFQFWLTIFSENMRQEQYWGTAEAIFLSPRSPLLMVLASASGKFFLLLLELAAYILAGIIIFGVALSPHLFVLIPFAIVNGIAFAGLGLFSASFIIYLKRGDPVNWLVSSSFDLLSGVYFPAAVLPYGLRVISPFLPTTSALNTWRNILLSGAMPEPSQVLVQFVWAFVLSCCGVIAFQIAFAAVRRNGELGSY